MEPLLLVVDDSPENRDIFRARLESNGYRVETAADGEEGLTLARALEPDLILLDIMMPKIDGIEVCRQLKTDDSLPFIPIILVTAKSDPRDVVVGLNAGAEEFLTKPVDQTALIARVKSMLRIKSLHDETQAQARELAELNQNLERRVAEQLVELERVNQLKRFFSPQITEFIVSSGDRAFMESHRNDISVLFCDLRNYTAFSRAVEPEAEMQLLRVYHETVGELIFNREATLEHIAGDGVMAFFNDPVPCADPARRAVELGLAMQREVSVLLEAWSAERFGLGFGVGIAHGSATLGHIGVEGQFHYAAVGPVANLASRLCDQARHGQVLIDAVVRTEVGADLAVESVGELNLKGYDEPVPAFNATALNGDGG